MTEQITTGCVCMRTIVEKGWPGHSKRKCGKPATCRQQDGLPICRKHYNQMMAKIAKKAIVRELIGPND